MPAGSRVSYTDIAERIGVQTRFPSLTLAVNTRSRSLSYSGTGVAIPPEDKASEVFKHLSPKEVQKLGEAIYASASEEAATEGAAGEGESNEDVVDAEVVEDDETDQESKSDAEGDKDNK